MVIKLSPQPTVLYQGDNFTYSGRREDSDPRIQAVRRLVEEFHAALLTADGLINQAAPAAGSTDLVAHDGVHPTSFGHRVLAQAWPDLLTIA
jgi:acyl-CoA thioesterase-1